MSLAPDGDWLAITNFLLGGLAMLVRPVRRWRAKADECFNLTDCVTDFLNGVTCMPFVLMVLALFYKAPFIQTALSENRVMVAVAGFIGLLFIGRELFYRK